MSKALQRSAVIIVAISFGFSLHAQQGAAPFGSNNGQTTAAQPVKSSQVDNLKAQYQHDVQIVVKPIQDGYVTALQALMKTLTQNRNLDQALDVERELKSTQAQAAPNYLNQVGNAGAAASGMGSPLDNLKFKYSSDLRTAIKPIQDRYAQALNNVLNTATQNGDLDDAVAARDELKNTMDTPPAGTAQNDASQKPDANGPGPGWYYVQSQISELYLHVDKGRHISGTHVYQDKKSGEQAWKFIPDGHGNYFIQSKIGQLFLNPKPAADDFMNEVDQTPDLVWKLIPDGNGNYFIQSVANGNDLDVFGAYKDVGNKVHLAPKDAKQVWKLIKKEGDDL